MEQREELDNFDFESREVYEQARKESEMIQQIREKVDLSDAKTALKLYNKSVSEKIFGTIIGYTFLMELRKVIVDSGLAEADTLAEIPVKEPEGRRTDVMPERPAHGDRYKRMYEGQKLLNKKLKIALFAFFILLVGFVVINFRFEYTIFTYFTDYKANMEEELIDKYEEWETKLEEREKQLGKDEGSVTD